MAKGKTSGVKEFSGRVEAFVCKQCERDIRNQDMPVFVRGGVLMAQCICGNFIKVRVY